MLRVQLTAEDLLRVSFAERPAPLAELGQAIGMLQRRDNLPHFASWRRRVVHGMPSQARPLLQLVSPLGAGPLFLDPDAPTLDEGLDRVMSTPRAVARSELRRMCAIDRPLTPWVRHLADLDREAWRILERALRTAYSSVVEREWPRIQSGFQAETAWRSRFLARHGLLRTLDDLSPSIRLRGLTLEADFPRELDITLSGKGIVLQPSVFWTGHPLVGLRGDGSLLLIYPAVTPLPLLDASSPSAPLTALLGGTRAQALRVLVGECTTTELARELDVTAAAASMQAKTLREAGLVVSRREGKTVRHWCTPLGLDLLAGVGSPV